MDNHSTQVPRKPSSQPSKNQLCGSSGTFLGSAASFRLGLGYVARLGGSEHIVQGFKGSVGLLGSEVEGFCGLVPFTWGLGRLVAE